MLTLEWCLDLEPYQKTKLVEAQANIILNEDYRAVSSDGLEASAPHGGDAPRIVFQLRSRDSICQQAEVDEARFLGSKATILRYYDSLLGYLEGSQKNYFKGVIRID